MRRVGPLALLLGLVLPALAPVPAAPAAPDASAASAASAAHAEVMVVGRERVLAGPRDVVLQRRAVRADRRRCAVGARTPLSALAGTGLALRITDTGACGRSPRDAGGLFVTRVGGEANSGRAGWVYKVGARAGTTGAADPSGPFGTGRGLGDGDRVLWFWCVLDSGDGCQRTLAISARSRVARGTRLAVGVRAYDDEGRGVLVAGAQVTFGGAVAATGPDGRASLPAPTRPGRHRMTATAPGLVAAFGETVRVS